MKLIKLFWRLLRYRVAVMLILFMLLGAAIHGGVSAHPWQLLIGAIALAFSYVSATSSNDISDREIDAINHPDSPGRPLITGKANLGDMWKLFISASIIAIVLGLLVSATAGVVICCSILINILYSLPPARLSYRTFLAPLTLGVAYVGVPYFLGLIIVNSAVTSTDTPWVLGFYFLFIGRIILKDFRDRKGDAKYHKPTFLLRFGKPATCIFSFACLVLGTGYVREALSTSWISILLWAYLACISYMLWRLYQSEKADDEQLSIGVGARLGNGLLISLLAIELLMSAHAAVQTQQIVAIVLTVIYLGGFANFLRNPEAAVIGYKG